MCPTPWMINMVRVKDLQQCQANTLRMETGPMSKRAEWRGACWSKPTSEEGPPVPNHPSLAHRSTGKFLESPGPKLLVELLSWVNGKTVFTKIYMRLFHTQTRERSCSWRWLCSVSSPAVLFVCSYSSKKSWRDDLCIFIKDYEDKLKTSKLKWISFFLSKFCSICSVKHFSKAIFLHY